MAEPPGIPQPLTPAAFKTWIGASRVFGRLAGLSDHATLSALWPRLTAGLVQAAAATILFKRRDATPRELFMIPADWWADSGELCQTQNHLWKHGTATMKLPTTGGSIGTRLAVDLFDVRFEPRAFWAIEQPAAPPSDRDMASALAQALLRADTAEQTIVSQKPETNRGRKPWPHWEDVWAEMVARAMAGEFSASIQADFERAMLEVAERYPDAPNESTVRLRAQKVWKSLPVKAEKSLA